MEGADLKDWYTRSELDKEEQEHLLLSVFTPDIIILFVYLVCGIFGNVVIIFFYKYKIVERKDKENRYFITYLASLDIAVCTLGSVFGIVLDLEPMNSHSDLFCKVVWFLTKVFVFSSGILLIVISIHRFRLICKPFHMQMTLHWKRVSIFISVFSGALIAVPSLFLYGHVSFYDRNNTLIFSTCGKLTEVSLTLQMSFDIFMILIGVCGGTTVIVLYSMVGKALYKQHNFRKQSMAVMYSVKPAHLRSTTSIDSNNLGNSRPTSLLEKLHKYENRNGTNSKSDSLNSLLSINIISSAHQYEGFWHKKENIRFSFMFFLISVIYLLAYTPRIYIMVREWFNDKFWLTMSTNEFRFHIFLYRIYILNNVANPIIYGMFDVRLKEEMKAFFCKCLRKTEARSV